MLEKLKYENNILHFDGININDIASKFGSPIYIYSKNKIIENFKGYDDAFKKEGIKNYCIHYAIKANDNLSILKLLFGMGAGVDCVSGNEIKKAIIGGVKAENVVFSGVSKSDDELEYAITIGAGQINIESYEEFLNIKKITKKINKIANISVRINPNIDADTHHKITTGKKENKFGVPLEIAEKIFSEQDSLLNFKGLSVHIGSQILNVEKFKDVLIYLKEIYKKHPEFTTIDIGGGLGIQYRIDEKLPLKADLIKFIKEYFGDYKGKIIIEPGRSIVGDACILLTKISYTKETSIKNFIMVNAGMNTLIRPSMYDAYHHPMLVNITNSEKKLYDIVGPICESGDVFVKDMKFEKPQGNNYIVFLSAGAYGYSMSSMYNLHGMVKEVWIDNGQVKEIRKPIGFEDLLKFEEI